MSPDPAWLPARVCFEDLELSHEEYVELIYDYFTEDFMNSKPDPFKGKRVGLKRHPLREDKEATFWHLITSGQDEDTAEDDREIDLDRCQHIRWPRPIMDSHEIQNLRCWPRVHKGETRWLIALNDFSYLVVIAERSTYVLPWTAYPVEQTHRKLKLYKEYLVYQDEVDDQVEGD